MSKGDLVHIVWSGGNEGDYRIEVDKFDNLFAVNNYYYHKDGTERDSEAIEALRFYNPIANNIKSIIKIQSTKWN